jgi:hypothetical protein
MALSNLHVESNVTSLKDDIPKILQSMSEISGKPPKELWIPAIQKTIRSKLTKIIDKQLNDHAHVTEVFPIG